MSREDGRRTSLSDLTCTWLRSACPVPCLAMPVSCFTETLSVEVRTDELGLSTRRLVAKCQSAARFIEDTGACNSPPCLPRILLKAATKSPEGAGGKSGSGLAEEPEAGSVVVSQHTV